MDVLAVHDIFSQLKLKVDSDSNTVNVVEYKYPGSKRNPSVYPIALTAIAPITYFQQHPPISIMGLIFGNPMMLMMLFSFAVIVFMPQLMQGLDEEQLKELQGNMANQDESMNSLKKLFGMEAKPDDDD